MEETLEIRSTNHPLESEATRMIQNHVLGIKKGKIDLRFVLRPRLPQNQEVERDGKAGT